MEQMTVEQIWKMVQIELQKNQDPYADVKAVYEFHVTDKDLTYQVAFQEGEVTFAEERTEEADCVLSMKESDFKKLLSGDLNSTMAFMTGKLKLKGNMQLALTLEKMLKQYEFSND